MQNPNYQKAFYCGHFTMNYTPALKNVLRNHGWLPEKFTSDMQKQEVHYYKNFTDFCFHSSIGEGIWSTRLPINKFFTVNDNSVFLNEIKLYILPYRIVLFSIETTLRGSLGNFCHISRTLRDISHYKNAPKPWIDLAIKPLIEIYKVLTGSDKANYTNLVENGSKMKVYQIVGGDFEDITQEQKYRILYKMGTFSINSDEMGDGMQISDKYIFKVLENNMLSVYKDWFSLSLLDTHTVISYKNINKDFVNKHVLFFRIIYLYELFSKCFLFDLHRRHHSVHYENTTKISLNSLLGIDSKPIDKLKSELNAFETRYAFYNISYDYLPLELHEYISRGLQVDDERKVILDIITREKENEDAQNAKKLNIIIRCLSLFTFFLSIPAACDLANHIFPFEKWMYNESVGYLFFSILFVILSILGVFLLVKFLSHETNPKTQLNPVFRKRKTEKPIKKESSHIPPNNNVENENQDLIDLTPWDIFENYYTPGSIHEGRIIRSFTNYLIITLHPYDTKAILYKDKDETLKGRKFRINKDYRFCVKSVNREDYYVDVIFDPSSFTDENETENES